MTPSLARRGFLAALIATAALAACSKTKTQSTGCETDQDCVDQYGSQRWYCDHQVSPPVCTESARECNSSADCCPSQLCNLSLHVCRDTFTTCPDPGSGNGAGSCPAAGEVCQTIGYEPSGFGCTFLACGPGGACASGTNCFNGFCVGETPCKGGCPPVGAQARVCVTETNYCSPAPADPTCQVTCPQGQMLVLTDPTNIFDRCTMPTTCTCSALPPLAQHDVARHSSLALAPNYAYVSTYDGQYGDLVVHTYAKSDLSKPIKSEWLDGVPATGTIGGDPSGPRHGITDPGPNVGEYTSIATSPNGDLFVSYYDVDNGALKFIARYGGANAVWTAPVTIDGSTAAAPLQHSGDVGLYTSIAVTSQGVPAIAYYRRASYDATSKRETGLHTGVVYAIALKAEPMTSADWKVVGDVDAADRPAPACNNACTSTQVCVTDGGADRCAQPAPASNPCMPACSSTTSCVLSANGQSSVCLVPKAQDGLTELPLGVGLTPALAFIDDRPIVAYYDSINRALKAVQATGGSAASPVWSSPVILDGLDAAPAPRRDTGRWPSIAIAPASVTPRIAIAFEDLTSQNLLLYTSNGLTPHAPHDGTIQGLIHVLDDGTPDKTKNEAFHPQSFPGAQSSVQFSATGKIAVAYQDATPVDLYFSVWDPAQNKRLSRTDVRSKGGSGFWPHLAIDGTTAYLSSATIRAATATLAGNQLFVETRPLP